MKFSSIEIRDLLKAWFAISLAFAILFTSKIFSSELLINFLIAGLTVGIGFLIHELAHKAMAQKYGYFSEFRSFDSMLVLAILMSFVGFVFAAPGGVMIRGFVKRDENGKISLAGPLTNVLLAVLFFVILKLNFTGFVGTLASFGFMINRLLAAFNMIPFWQFDGLKIFMWNKVVYFIVVGVLVVLFVV